MNIVRGSLFALALAAPLLGVTAAQAAGRVALVVGNGAYQNAPPLPNPVNDAGDVAAALKRLDFDVKVLSNAKYDEMRRALVSFGQQARRAEFAVIFFAGHGMETGGENWLIPVDAQLAADADVPGEAIGLQFLMRSVSSARKLGLVILDACRNNPFLQKMQRTNMSRATERGFVRVEPNDNILVAYSARDGTTASDGQGRNSPFTEALLNNLEKPGLEVRFLFANVRDDVMESTNREQQPFTYGSLSKEQIYLKPQTEKPQAEKPQPEKTTDQLEAEKQKKQKDRLARDEEHAYQTAQGDLPKLRQYVSTCTLCAFTEAANQSIATLERAEKLQASRRDEQNYKQARGSLDLLNAYVQTCGPCTFKTSALEEITKLESEAKLFMLKVCNKSPRKVSVAVMGRTLPENEDWHVQGWWSVPAGQCNNIRKYVKGMIYLFAQEDGNPAMAWKGKASELCVASPGPFDRVNRDGYACQAAERSVGFSSFSVTDRTFTWNLNP